MIQHLRSVSDLSTGGGGVGWWRGRIVHGWMVVGSG